MRNVYTAILILAGMMVVPAQAQENDVNAEQPAISHHQFLSKRPYQAPVVASKADAEPWVGATLVTGQDQKEKHLQILRMHSIGKRPL